MLYRIIFILFTFLLFSCKVSKITDDRNADDNADNLISADSAFTSVADTIIQESAIFITQTGDTLYSLDEEVEIGVSRTRKNVISFSAVGDIMMGTNFPSSSYLPKNNGDRLWRDVKSDLLDADITFGNLEGVILSEGGEQKKCNNPKACYLFRTPEYLAYQFKENGFDLLSVANNHANDFGQTGRSTTQKVLDSLNIVHAGSVENPISILKLKGVSVGFVAFAPNKGTQSIHDEENAIKMVQSLDSLTDIVVVSFHAGAEGSKHQHVTKSREFYYGEDRGNVYEFSHLMIENGADVILGHGPHVVRGIEVFKGKLIAYSLGNFLTYGRFNLKGPNAYSPLLKFHINSTGECLDGEIVSYIQDYNLGPIPDSKFRATNTIKNLSEIDFPENEISIDDSGKIIYLHR